MRGRTSTKQAAKKPRYSYPLEENRVYLGDNRDLLPLVNRDSVALSVWSPPYFVGKSYEKDLSFEGWTSLLEEVVRLHYPIVKPGGFLAINIADILTFKDASMPKIQAEVVSSKKIPITKEDILSVLASHPDWDKYRLAKHFGCSEQTIERRLKGNNIRGGKYSPQTKVKLVGGLIESFAEKAGFYLYDRRVWVKDPAWASSQWHNTSYRSVDEFEYIYIFWKPGPTKIDRSKLSKQEWASWGSRGVWSFPSVRANRDHEAKFPLELPARLIRLLSFPGDLVIDPFLGSGTTVLAAIKTGRKFIGIEKEPRYFALSEKNISTAIEQKPLLWEGDR